MKTHINQILTVVSFFSLSLTTTLAISWGINGLVSENQSLAVQCLEQNSALTQVTQVIQANSCPINYEYNHAIKLIIPKINLKSNG